MEKVQRPLLTSHREPFFFRLWLAQIGRIVVATLVVSGSFSILGWDTLQTPSGLALLALAALAYISSGINLWALSHSWRWAFGFHLASDLLLTTALVYLSSGPLSAFAALYGVTVLTTALLASSRITLMVGGLALLVYASLSLALIHGAIPLLPDQDPLHEVADQTSLFASAFRNAFGIALVSALAVLLARRLHRAEEAFAKEAQKASRLQIRHEDILRSLNSGLLTINASGTIESANPAAASILGWSSPQELIGKNPRAFFEGFEAQPGTRFEATGIRRDGSCFPVGYSVAPLRALEGEALGLVVIFQDLTEIVELRRQVEHNQRLAWLGTLAAGLAHEIRNPLASIRGLVEIVQECPALGSEEKRWLGMVLREVDRLEELVKTMLEVGRKTPPARMRVNLRPIVEEVVTLAKSQKESVRIELTQEEEIWGDVDPRQIRQVLWNVIRNAIQFSPEGGAVHIALKRASQEAIVEISDEGPGIPEKEREAIFDMFFSKRPSGFGLGLALSRQIVEAHGGHIEVLDRKPHGSRFVIRIPDLPSKTPSLTLGPTPHAAQ